jgi:hypothetical protein
VVQYFRDNLHTVTDECKIWPYSKAAQKGYGVVYIEGRQYYVHALACEARNGPRPDGMQAAHGPCWTAACWNGAHLSWKTRQENMADTLRDGTAPIGSRNGMAKLTALQVAQLREDWRTERPTQVVLAARYGISQGHVSVIVNGLHWKQ